VRAQSKRFVVFIIATFMLSACGGALQGDLFQKRFWQRGIAQNNDLAELGIAELAKGNYVTAEGHFKVALERDNRDIEALMGLAMLYQNTGQPTKAREMYEAVLALRPNESQQFMVMKTLSVRPISEVASVNLALLESGGVLTGLGRGQAVSSAAGTLPTQFPNLRAAPVKSAPAFNPLLGRQFPAPAGGRDAAGFSTVQKNVANRFHILSSLKEEGLITPDEHAARRRANIGSLLPLTSPPPATGLDRPVPSAEQISGRLRAISRALELRAISVGQHASERTMILDALMPSAPISVANPGMPPRGLMEAADRVRWLEQLKKDSTIGSDEYARERKAVEAAMQPAAPKMDKRMVSFSNPSGPQEKAMSKGGVQSAVHLASYRSKGKAEAGWRTIKRKHSKLLNKLDSEIVKVNLGPGKGVFYRLKVGPVADKKAAGSLCSKLKRRRQFCEPSFMNAG
jgi:tetratricopeptide (TPR) repeat protein